MHLAILVFLCLAFVLALCKGKTMFKDILPYDAPFALYALMRNFLLKISRHLWQKRLAMFGNSSPAGQKVTRQQN